MKTKFDVFVEVVKIIFVIMVLVMSIITIVLILLVLFGESPTEITVLSSIIAILIALQTVIMGILFQMKEDMGSLKEFRRQTIYEVKGIGDRLITIKKVIKRNR